MNELGVPCATELLDPIVRHYVGDLLAWACIGARTSESQIHREMASGLPLPVGIKNPTSGELGPAADALVAARSPHRHLGVAANGGFARIETPGNPDAHLVLRGGASGPNYAAARDRARRGAARAARARAPDPRRLLARQLGQGSRASSPPCSARCWRSSRPQRAPILGAMLESHLFAGPPGARRGPASSRTACPSPTRVWAGTTPSGCCASAADELRASHFRATSG